MAIARSCINHTIRFDLRHLALAALGRTGASAASVDPVAEFEQRFAAHVGTTECIAFPFARSAFYALLGAMDLEEGDEVILPPITIHAMLDAVVARGCRPVVVDIEPETLLFAPSALAAALTDRTRVVMITYLFGIAADPTPLIERCRRSSVLVVEDFSHNLDATVAGRRAGTFGDVGIYSSSATKTLDTYGGGLAVTDDAALATRLRAAQSRLVPAPRSRLVSKVVRTLIWNVASSRATWTVATFPLVRYLRRRHPALEQAISGAPARPKVSTGPSDPWFERFGPLQAQAGLEQLTQLRRRDRARVVNAEQLRSTLRYLGIPVPIGSPGGEHVHWQCVGYVDDVERVQEGLGAAGVDAAPTNLPLICDCDPTSCTHPTAAAVKAHALYLPCHPDVGRRALSRIAWALVRLRPTPSASLTRVRTQ